MEDYIRGHQNKFAEYIDARSRLDLCEGLESVPGARVGMQWWEQVVINLEGEREVSAAAAERGGGEE